MSAREMVLDSVTVARARGRRLAKLIRPNGAIEGYDSTAKSFDLFAVRICGLEDLHDLLGHLVDRPDCCIVRGDIADPARTRGVRRLLHADPATGDQPTLIDLPRRWLPLDIDGLPRPEEIAATDLGACAALTIRALPVEFQDVRLIAQATAGHGLKPGLRLRLFVWLDRPVTGAEAKRWLRNAPVDCSVFGASQVIYTARPRFCVAATDPIPERLVMLNGPASAVRVPAVAATPRPPMRPIPLTANAAGASRYGLAALARATNRMMRAADGARHPTLLTEATGLAKLVARNLLPEDTVSAALGAVAAKVGLPEREVADVIAWALAHSSSRSSGAVR